MRPVNVELDEQVPDEGQWFERGTRVAFVEAARPGRRRLEAAALGSYEVCGVRVSKLTVLAGSPSGCDHSAYSRSTGPVPSVHQFPSDKGSITGPN